MKKEEVPLEVLTKLFKSLNDNNIRYCSWKSNYHLIDGLTGITDIDLLVSQKDVNDFKGILLDHDFHHFNSQNRYDQIYNYLGFDSRSGKLVHLHVHYNILTGASNVKDYNFPLVETFLETSQKNFLHSVKIPSPEVELAVSFLRIIIKSGYEKKDHDCLSEEEFADLSFLSKQVNLDIFSNFFKRTFVSEIESDLRLFLEDFDNNETSLFNFKEIRDSLLPKISRYRLKSRYHVFFKTTYNRYKLIYNKYLFSIKKKLFGHNNFSLRPKFTRTKGVSIAFIGVDGSGKSTVVNDISKWLGWKVCYFSFYMGSNNAGKITNNLVEIQAKLKKIKNLFTSDSKQTPLTLYFSFLLFCNKILIGLSFHRDKYIRFRNSKRVTAAGGVSIFDRFPIHNTLEVLPLNQIGNTFLRIFYKKLVSKNTYSLLPSDLPDKIILLDVSPEISFKRKQEQSLASIKSRRDKVLKAKELKLVNTTINSNLPLESVILDSRINVWKYLTN